MKSKKGIIILSSVVAVCAAGLILSHFIDWPVDHSEASGNIGKSARFSRKTAVENVSNMEELIKSDASYRNGIVTAYMVMQTRAQQFSSLVDMSNEVAGEIPEFEKVLDEMNKVYVTVNNVCASLVRAGENLNATLSGEKRPELAQNTINASLAYTTLQKQNKLATEFIDVTDKYVKNAEADDRLLFVRDQWRDYQLMTAALEGDEKSAQELQDKGALLASEKAAAALGSFEMGHVIAMVEATEVCKNVGVETSLSNAFPADVLSQVIYILENSSVASQLSNATDVNQLQSGFTQEDALKAMEGMTDALQSTAAGTSFLNALQRDNLQNSHEFELHNSHEFELHNSHEFELHNAMSAGNIAFFNTTVVAGLSDLMSAYTDAAASIKAFETSGALQANACAQLNAMIEATTIGGRPRILD
ncbi:MAG: hypothetical protein E7109_03480 [Bacteroidales bacterium]|jgi:hypothetical protein|nr:hypothetical protein [Bacteroidales bacterium]